MKIIILAFPNKLNPTTWDMEHKTKFKNVTPLKKNENPPMLVCIGTELVNKKH